MSCIVNFPSPLDYFHQHASLLLCPSFFVPRKKETFPFFPQLTLWGSPHQAVGPSCSDKGYLPDQSPLLSSAASFLQLSPLDFRSTGHCCPLSSLVSRTPHVLGFSWPLGHFLPASFLTFGDHRFLSQSGNVFPLPRKTCVCLCWQNLSFILVFILFNYVDI